MKAAVPAIAIRARVDMAIFSQVKFCVIGVTFANEESSMETTVP